MDPQTQWTRGKLQVLLGASMLVLVALVGGAVWSVIALLAPSESSEESVIVGDQSERDQLAADELPSVPLEAAQPGSVSSGSTGTMELPLPMEVGAAGVASGFPQTPQGALAQLAAIDSAVMGSASVREAQNIVGQWVAPEGPSPETWSGVVALATLLEAAGMPADAQQQISISAQAEMGFIKGEVGDEFVVPCIDFLLTATPVGGQPRQVAAADCQRMVWHEGRWVIGAGEEPAPAPSVWPGSQASFDAGYLWLEVPQS